MWQELLGSLAGMEKVVGSIDYEPRHIAAEIWKRNTYKEAGESQNSTNDMKISLKNSYTSSLGNIDTFHPCCECCEKFPNKTDV